MEHTALIDFVIGFTLCEGLLLAWWYRRTGQGVAPVKLVANLCAGLALMLAVRAALVDGAGLAMGAWLLAAGVSHAVDLWYRWRSPRTA